MNQLTPEQLDMVKRLQPLFKEKMVVITEGDMFFNPFRKAICFVDKGTLVIDGCLVIPKPIDWQNPKRGCWGILEGTKTLYDHGLGVSHKTGYKYYPEPDPFTALLKALAEQEGV